DLPVAVLLNMALHHHLATTSRSADRPIRIAEAVTPSSSNRRQRWVVFIADTRLNNPSNSTAPSRLNLSRLSSRLTQHLPRNTLLRGTNRQGTSPRLRLRLRLKHRVRHRYLAISRLLNGLTNKQPIIILSMHLLVRSMLSTLSIIVNWLRRIPMALFLLTT
ncbi:hypothetical protein GGF37_005619, partial [Kickxella alabastrina]